MLVSTENEAVGHCSDLQSSASCVTEDKASAALVVKDVVDLSLAIWASSGLTPPR